MKILSAQGIKTNVTLIFSSAQALLAAKAGATYVSPFVGRVDDISNNGINLITDIVEIFEVHNIETQIISANIRSPQDVVRVAIAGSDIATVPYKVINAMIEHPLTNAGIEKFISDWSIMDNKK